MGPDMATSDTPDHLTPSGMFNESARRTRIRARDAQTAPTIDRNVRSPLDQEIERFESFLASQYPTGGDPRLPDHLADEVASGSRRLALAEQVTVYGAACVLDWR